MSRENCRLRTSRVRHSRLDAIVAEDGNTGPSCALRRRAAALPRRRRPLGETAHLDELQIESAVCESVENSFIVRVHLTQRCGRQRQDDER